MKKNVGAPSVLAAAITVLVFSAIPAIAQPQNSGGAKKVDPCSLLTKVEIQEAIGKTVQDGKLNTKANAAVGLPCEFGIEPYGSVSILALPAGGSNTPDKTIAELKKAGIKIEDAPGIGDRSVFAYPGYGMLQLITWKGGNYIILILLVPDATEAQQKTAAEKLMGKVLPRL
jgi:hypothetical protein